MTEGQLMILAGKGDASARAELDRRWKARAEQYQQWRAANPGRSAAVAFSNQRKGM
jgi:hypothetical protein